MADDWQVGDLALCVRDGFIIHPTVSSTARPEIKKGRIYTVSWVGVDGRHEPQPSLGLEEAVSPAPRGGFAQERFRKIRTHTPDAEDAETIRLLTGAPARQPVEV